MKKLLSLFLISQCLFVLPSYAEKKDSLINSYEDIIIKKPNNIDNYIKLGDIYLNTYKNNDKALENYYNGINLSKPKIIPNNIEHRNILDYMSKQLWDNSIDNPSLEIYIQQIKKISELYLKISIIYSDLKDEKKQEINLIKAIEINPFDWRFYNNLGNLYKEQKQFAKAIQVYNQALNNTKDYAYLVKLNIANTYSEMNEIDKAIDIYKSIIKDKPELTPVYYNLAVIYINKNNNKEAINVLKDLLEKEYSTDVVILITATYLKDKNYQEVLDFINSNVDKKNQAGFYYKLLGEVYLDKGDMKLANDNFALSCKNGDITSCQN